MADLDLAMLVGGKADRFEPQPLGVGPAPDGNQDIVRLDRLRITAGCRLYGEGYLLTLHLRAGDLGRKAKLHPLPGEQLARLLAHLAIHPDQDLIEKLDDSD